MKSFVKLAVIGVSGRGMGLIEAAIFPMDDVEITAVCDLYDDRIENAANMIEKEKGKRPVTSTNYKDIINMPEIDAVLIATSWQDHFKITIDCMKAGKYVACEVGGSYSLEQCWQLVRTYEETGTPCMMLENCCYGKEELMVLNMVKQGLFGEVVYAKGGYHHDLREEISMGQENRHYRLGNYLNRNCENYPTHELGPIAKIMNINRGNLMTSLVSVSSKSAGLHDYIVRRWGENCDLAKKHFNQGDIVTTIITCANGEQIVLTLDTTLPRSYSRGFQVRGTRGMFDEDKYAFYFDECEELKKYYKGLEVYIKPEEMESEYIHPIWKEFLEDGVKGGHGGMDYLVCRAFIESVMTNQEPPIDVYDMASWACITSLSEQSVALGGHPVFIPDFTEGKWFTREKAKDWKYSL